MKAPQSLRPIDYLIHEDDAPGEVASHLESLSGSVHCVSRSASSLEVQQGAPFSEWTSVVYVAGSSPVGSMLEVSGQGWVDDVSARLLFTCTNLQHIAARLRQSKGRIVLVWAESEAPQQGSTSQGALNGGYTSLVKSLARDLAPVAIGVNGLVLPDQRSSWSLAAIAQSAELLASPRIQAMVGQLLRPTRPSGTGSWGLW